MSRYRLVRLLAIAIDIRAPERRGADQRKFYRRSSGMLCTRYFFHVRVTYRTSRSSITLEFYGLNSIMKFTLSRADIGEETLASKLLHFFLVCLWLATEVRHVLRD
jgi:hypothetical protein